MKQEILSFYHQLLGSAAPSLPAIDLVTIRKGSRLSEDACNKLLEAITTTEIDQALASINDQKAPGLDAFGSLFFKKT